MGMADILGLSDMLSEEDVFGPLFGGAGPDHFRTRGASEAAQSLRTGDPDRDFSVVAGLEFSGDENEVGGRYYAMDSDSGEVVEGPLQEVLPDGQEGDQSAGEAVDDPDTEVAVEDVEVEEEVVEIEEEVPEEEADDPAEAEDLEQEQAEDLEEEVLEEEVLDEEEQQTDDDASLAQTSSPRNSFPYLP